MKTAKQIILFSSVLLASTIAQAFLNVQALQKQTQERISKKSLVVSTKADPNKCVNFSGTWKGSCEGPEGKKSSTLVIEQNGCATINLYNEGGSKQNSTYDLTGVGTSISASTTVYGSLNIIVGLRWNADQTVIQMAASALVNSAFMPSSPMQGLASGQLLMDGEELVEFIKTDGTVFQTPGDESCRYSKVK